MNSKPLVLILNFISFGLIFFLVRFGVPLLGMSLGYVPLTLMAGLAAILLAPKFNLVQTEGKSKIVVNWLFQKKK